MRTIGSFLSDNLVLITTVAIGLASVTLTWLMLRNQQRKALTWDVLWHVPIVRVRSDSADKVQVTFEGQAVQNVLALIIQICNVGNAPILAGDYEEPIRIRIAHGRILSAETGENQKVDLLPTVDEEGHMVTLEPKLLNGSDTTVLTLLIADLEGEIELDARIAGVQHIERTDKVSTLLTKACRVLGAVVSLVLGVVAFVVATRDVTMSGWPLSIRLLAAFGVASLFYVLLTRLARSIIQTVKHWRKGLVWTESIDE